MGEIRSPYFSSGGDYLGHNAEIHSPYVPFGTQDYDGDNAEFHSSYFSVGDYHGDDAEIPSETFFRQVHSVENPYNTEQGIVQSTFKAEKPIQQKDVEQLVYRVPHHLRQQPGDIFTPQEISIGPFHQMDKPQLKEKFYKEFCNRLAKKKNPSVTVRDLSNIIEKNKTKIGQFYGIQNLDEEFLEMVLWDAAFILEYMLKSEEGTLYKYKLISGNVRLKIRSDLILLENQLPYFILKKLYDRLYGDGKGKYTTPFRLLACAYFKRHINSPYEPKSRETILHFTDLVRSLLSFKHPYPPARVKRESIHSATEMDKAAIKFKGVQDQGLLDIDFSPKGEFTIPRLQINENTDRLFGNLQAFEIFYYPAGERYICHYVRLLDGLIPKFRDADLLIGKDIIMDVAVTNEDGAAKSSDVKGIIDKLISVETTLSEEKSRELSCYYSVYEGLDGYYQKYWPNSFAYLRETYFGNLWRGTATATATVLLILAFAQALCSYLALPSQYKGGVILCLLLLLSGILFVSSLIYCL